MVTHANVTRLLHATSHWYRFGASDTWVLLHSYSFDVSVWEMWGALFYGGRLIVASRNLARSPEALCQLICAQRVTVLNQTPSAFRQLLQAPGVSRIAKHLRFVIFAGESLDVRTLGSWFEQVGSDGPALINKYGITETTVHTTYRRITIGDWRERPTQSPIGVRIPDLRLYVLDDKQKPVPIGVPGELYVGGAGVARGYWCRPELTAEAIPNGSVRDRAWRENVQIGRHCSPARRWRSQYLESQRSSGKGCVDIASSQERSRRDCEPTTQ